MTSQNSRRSYIWWMAWRNFSARRQGGGLSFMTTVSVIGVAIGVAALIVVLSVMGGFEQDMRQRMLTGQPHMQILGENATGGFSLKEHPLSELQRIFPEARGMEPFTEADVVIKRRNFIGSATLIGVLPENKGRLWGFRDSKDVFFDGGLDELSRNHTITLAENPATKKPGEELPGILLGEKLASQLGADLGDELTVLSPQAHVGSLLSGGTLSRRFVVAGKFSTNMFDYDQRWAIVHLNDGRRFIPDFDETLADDEFVTAVGLNVDDPYIVPELAKRIAPKSGLQVLTWQTVNKALLFALKLEKFAMGSVLMLVVLVAAFSISGTMMMTVYHKRGQVSLLRSLGMTKKDITKLFLAHGFTIGTVGITLGLLIGLGMCWVVGRVATIPLPIGVYYAKSLPVRFLPVDYFVICALAWVFSLVAAVYPALTAARQNPSMGLRYE